MSAATAAGRPEDPVHADQPVLEVAGLTLTTDRDGVEVPLVSDVDVRIAPGEAIGVIGESGSGKSLLVRAIAGLLPPGVRRAEGRVGVAGVDLTQASAAELRSVRGKRLGMVFQDSIGSLDPLFTVGSQVVEAMRVHRRMSRAAGLAEAERLLSEVGITQPHDRLSSYPHELSGGMAQRVAIAIAVANSPDLLIADEATTALDVTVQKQVIGLIKRIQAEQGCSVLFVSHDLATVASLVDRVLVMYAGSIVEEGPTEQVLHRPKHPYTAALLKSRPQLGVRSQPVQTLPGGVPLPGEWPNGCRFHPRCPIAREDPCSTQPPELTGDPHRFACHFPLDQPASEQGGER